MTRHEYVKNVLEPRFKSEDELYHHGIIGMKWGIRRYQNEDGSLTPEGRKRYLNNDGGSGLTEAGKKEISKRAYDALRNHEHIIENIHMGYRDEEEWQKSLAEVKQIAKNVYDSIDEQTKQDIKNKEQKWYDSLDAETEYENAWKNSKERQDAENEAIQLAYEDILNNPASFQAEYSILSNSKLNDDEKYNKIKDYRYFNKLYEGYYMDYTQDKYQKEFNKTYKVPNSDRLWDSYWDAKEKAFENALGKYGNKKLDRYRSVSQVLSRNLED